MRCACWDCRKNLPVRRMAPRLARAYDLKREHHRERLLIQDELLQAERLLAHRELQILRAGATRTGRFSKGVRGKASYLSKRQNKLRDAERLVKRLRVRLEEAA